MVFEVVSDEVFEVREEGGGGAGWDDVFDVESEVEGQGSDLRREL